MQTIVECVPNFSEGRDGQRLEAIVQALLAGPDVYLLAKEMDPDHHRSVVTFVGTCESVGEAALRAIGKAARLIDMTGHRGVHPRIGSTDVVPFVPVKGVTLQHCAAIARFVAEQTWRRFHIPTYLYEAAALDPKRKHLENVRRGQLERLREEIGINPGRHADFGGARLHPTAGATAVGARKFLIAYNVNLDSTDIELAKAIARKIRASSGGLPCVKAMGVKLKARNCVQVSINLADFETTPIKAVFDAITAEAARAKVRVQASEIVGLVPRRALSRAAARRLMVKNYSSDLILENRLAHVIKNKPQNSSPGRAVGTRRQ